MPAPIRPTPYTVQQNALSVPKGLVGYYTDIETDALLAGISGPTVDLSAYATTAYVDGELVKVYSKAEVDQLLVDIATGGTVDLGGYAKVEDLPIVYEQLAEPVGKDGDLWLGPEIEPVAAPAPQPVIEGQPQGKSMTETEVKSIVRTMIAGGKEPPVDFDWTPLVSVKGTGLIEAKQTNGVLLLRGELVFTYSSAGTYTTVRTLPAKLPKPLVNCSAVVTGKENGLAFRFVSVNLTTSGDLNVVASGGKFTHVSFDGMIAYVC